MMRGSYANSKTILRSVMRKDSCKPVFESSCLAVFPPKSLTPKPHKETELDLADNLSLPPNPCSSRQYSSSIGRVSEDNC